VHTQLFDCPPTTFIYSSSLCIRLRVPSQDRVSCSAPRRILTPVLPHQIYSCLFSFVVPPSIALTITCLHFSLTVLIPLLTLATLPRPTPVALPYSEAAPLGVPTGVREFEFPSCIVYTCTLFSLSRPPLFACLAVFISFILLKLLYNRSLSMRKLMLGSIDSCLSHAQI